MNLKARFSEPPAPPPQQPLPAKPDAHSSLRRADTEKPKGNGSPVRSDAQTSTLTEALNNAKKELESQSSRLRDLEIRLGEERRAREDAEERANRLERERETSEHAMANGETHKAEPEDDPEETETVVANGSTSPSLPDVATTRLQQRLDTMMSEMNEMKIQMEKYRERAETAEADRKSLSEMIENIRLDNAKQVNKEAKRRSRSDSDLSGAASKVDSQEDEEETEQGEITIINDEVDEEGAAALLRSVIQNGRPAQREAAADGAKPHHALVTRQNQSALVHGAPAVSILTVVALGVAVMAWLNNYPKVER
jgi:chromosome segregation ATPase